MSTALLTFLALASGAFAHAGAKRPFATLPHLGPAPQRCFQFGSSNNICNGASFPYPPNANFLYSTYYGTVSVAPHVVGVGQDITATAAIDNNGRPSWGGVPGRIVSGCKGTDTTCTWKATSPSAYPPDAGAPGGGYDAFSMGFCGFNGCAQSQDFYYVLPRKKAISGMVLRNTTDAKGHLVVQPVAGAVVQISGSHGGTALSQHSGFYDALVDPGKYTVAVQSVSGQQASAAPSACSPGSASNADCRLDVRGGDGNADFIVCPGIGPARDHARATAAAAGAACPLTVTLKRLDGGRAGMIDDGGEPSFLDATGNCESGCSDVEVSVTDPGKHNQPVPGATVQASIAAPPAANVPDYPGGKPSGYLCELTRSAQGPTQGGCPGRYIAGLKTDGQGHLYLRYYSPGLIPAQSSTKVSQPVATTLKVVAKESCTASQCSAQQKSGHQSLQLKLVPNLIHSHDGTLSRADVDELAKWTSRFGINARFFTSEGIETAAKKAIDELVAEEHRAEQLSTSLERISGVFQVFEFSHALWEQYKFMSEFLDENQLSAVGLGRPPDQGVVSAAPSKEFIDALAGDGVPPLHLLRKGILWKLGEQLNFVEHHQPSAFGAQFTKLKVYEVSYCVAGGDCGPGYHGHAGIRPYLYIRYESGRSRFQNVFTGTFVIPYNAAAWMLAQFDGR